MKYYYYEKMLNMLIAVENVQAGQHLQSPLVNVFTLLLILWVYNCLNKTLIYFILKWPLPNRITCVTKV